MNDSIRTQIESLDSLRLPELQARYAEVLGEETRCPNKRYLIRRITEALEAGGGEPAAAGTAEVEVAEDAPAEAVTEAVADDAPAETTGDEALADEEADTAPEPDGDAGDDADQPAEPEAAAGDGSTGNGTRLTKLSVPELQALYLETVGRPTSSGNKRYLVWKVRQAQRGRIPVGPRRRRHGDGPAPDFKVLPLRMEAELVAQLDEARERLGLKSRMELFRRSLHAFLLEAGEVRVAEMFAPEA